MAKQRTFASEAWSRKGKVTRRERFLAEMDLVIPWERLIAVIEPPYHSANGLGRKPHDLERMLRIYFLQQWFNLSDPQAEDSIYDSESMRRFARVELGDDRIPDESTILRFRHLLEKHRLTDAIFEAVKELLEERSLLLRSGTIVDATIIAAPSSTKNATKTRDPEMKQTRKGNQWYFGMKLHIGTDRGGPRTRSRRRTRRRRTSGRWRTCSTARRAWSTATRPTGRRPIARPSRRRACATESIGGRRVAIAS